MSVTATRTITIVYTGNVTGTETIEALSNTPSPGSVEVKTLALGDNTILVPTGGTTVTAVTIVPPIGNTVSITLKGISGDTGIRIHDVDPTSLAIDSTTTFFTLTTAINPVIGVRFYWS